MTPVLAKCGDHFDATGVDGSRKCYERCRKDSLGEGMTAGNLEWPTLRPSHFG